MIKFILFLFPVTLLATEIDLSGLNIEKAKKDTKKINTGGSISGEVFGNFVVDTIESIKNAPASDSYNQNNYSNQPSNNSSSSSKTYTNNKSSSSSRRGVKRIASNGRVSGVTSQRIVCTGGSDYVVYYKNGKWYKNASHMGNKFNSWSVNRVGDYLCK